MNPASPATMAVTLILQTPRSVRCPSLAPSPQAETQLNMVFARGSLAKRIQWIKPNRRQRWCAETESGTWPNVLPDWTIRR